MTDREHEKQKVKGKEDPLVMEDILKAGTELALSS